MGSFERVFQQINLGDLQGNRFSVALRFIPIEVSNKQIESQVDVVKRDGFINYFGMQRFGCYNIHTHEIGREVLLQNWEKVIRQILGQYPEVDDDKKALKEKILKKLFEQDDVDGAIVLLDRRDRLEKSILLNLRKFPYSYYNAF